MGRSARVTAALRKSGHNLGGVPVPSLGVGTHLEALAWAATQAPAGAVLEMGSGVFSTPWLHGWCEGEGRSLLTVETDEDWFAYNKELYGCDWHTFTTDLTPPDGEWAMVFVDGGGATWKTDRVAWIEHFRETGAIVVAHDIDERFPPLREELSKYAHVKLFERLKPPTGVGWS